MSHLDHSIPMLVHTHYTLDTADLPFWMDLAKAMGGPILELGCGTGRILLQVEQAGFTAVGLDHDRAMLIFLRSMFPKGVEGRIQLVQANLVAFHFGCSFPLIYLPCNTLSTLRRPDREALFGRVVEHLMPGGIFAASIPNPEWLAGLPRLGEEELEETLIHPVSGNPLQISSSWKRQADTFRLSWHYDQLLPDGQVERITLETAHDLARLEDYRAGLESVGLVIERIYGDFDRSEYTARSPNLILVTRWSG